MKTSHWKCINPYIFSLFAVFSIFFASANKVSALPSQAYAYSASGPNAVTSNIVSTRVYKPIAYSNPIGEEPLKPMELGSNEIALDPRSDLESDSSKDRYLLKTTLLARPCPNPPPLYPPRCR
jgi:hypothetical protein